VFSSLDVALVVHPLLTILPPIDESQSECRTAHLGHLAGDYAMGVIEVGTWIGEAAASDVSPIKKSDGTLRTGHRRELAFLPSQNRLFLGGRPPKNIFSG
jgi:hypothetical protein